MFTIYQAMMILVGIWIILVMVAIRNRINYLKEMGDPMEKGDIWSRRRSRRVRKSKKREMYEDFSEEELEKARQERGKRMREFNKKREKLASKATDRQDYLMVSGKSKEELKNLLQKNSVGDKLYVDKPEVVKQEPDWMMLGEAGLPTAVVKGDKVETPYGAGVVQEVRNNGSDLLVALKFGTIHLPTKSLINNGIGPDNLDNTMRKKVVVEYDDTKSTTHGEYSKTLSDRLDPRDTILSQRPAHFKINDKPLSWTI